MKQLEIAKQLEVAKQNVTIVLDEIFLMETVMENSPTIAKCNCDVASSQCKQSVVNHMSFGDITLTDAERQRCEIWTRVMGYYRPTDSFNIGKKQEADERKYFKPVCDTELQKTHFSSPKSNNSDLEHAGSEELGIQTQRICPDCVTIAAA